ncbi:hypothetical protein L1887_01857 [Cichorium endivia]|nr:hypothetical protein L1887_01857 [Cichorium endivia]
MDKPKIERSLSWKKIRSAIASSNAMIGGRISDSELLDSIDGGRALQLKYEINVESKIIQRGTTKRDRDQPLVYGVPNLCFFKDPIPVGASKLN